MRHEPAAAGAISSTRRRFSSRAAALIAVVLIYSSVLSGYSVLTHEEIVDLLWTAEIQPLLLQRYPGLSEDRLKDAHAFAYGGAEIGRAHV